MKKKKIGKQLKRKKLKVYLFLFSEHNYISKNIMLAEGLNNNLIAKVTNLTQKELEKLKEEL